jgi:hypothetical protein
MASLDVMFPTCDWSFRFVYDVTIPKSLAPKEIAKLLKKEEKKERKNKKQNGQELLTRISTHEGGKSQLPVYIIQKCIRKVAAWHT